MSPTSKAQYPAPCILLWETWKVRNAALFDGTSPLIPRLINKIKWWLHYIQSGGLSPSSFPPGSLFSVNRISSSRAHPGFSPLFRPDPTTPFPAPASGNPGPSGSGGTCKDDKGVFLFAFLECYRTSSNVHAELRAIHDGILRCLSRGLKKIIVESDSQLIIGFLVRATTPGWKWSYWLARIRHMAASTQVKFMHTLREGNAPVDELTKMDSKSKSSLFFNSYVDFPQTVRGLIFLDKVVLGALRSKVSFGFPAPFFDWAFSSL
ncbi:uncharacterized protein LOC131245580 [Magnolia sinica]|uniref:uncharacterized protein LOC131245580 n=1 Tax=Magnolia sinica TaxID=86752 RepID=UPI00265842D5|nr:uncharacterized protein LOC131245580 [Magnolia sinica]